jgi:hypothetical protein
VKDISGGGRLLAYEKRRMFIAGRILSVKKLGLRKSWIGLSTNRNTSEKVLGRFKH